MVAGNASGLVTSCFYFPQGLVLGCPFTGMGLGSQRSSMVARLASTGAQGPSLDGTGAYRGQH